jgi:phosphoserine phosphatase
VGAFARQSQTCKVIDLRRRSKLVGRIVQHSNMSLESKEKEQEAKNIFTTADAVAFDVDSTVLMEEGIDVLAEVFGVREQVAQVTVDAMNGRIKMQEALPTRLNLINPTVKGLEDLHANRPIAMCPGIGDLVKKLHDRQVHVYLVSGGFKQMIEPVRQELGIPESRVYANELLFDADGKYTGYDLNAPTSRSGGKREVAQLLKDTHGYKKLVFIGDGATDLEARPPADCFIGYGGVAVRAKVKEQADWFIADFAQLIDLLQ